MPSHFPASLWQNFIYFFWGACFLLTQSIGEGFLSTLLRVEVAVMVLA